jgi:hypothetical protein
MGTNVLAMVQMDRRERQLRETFGCADVPHIHDPVDMSDDCMLVESGSALNLLQDMNEDNWWRHICVENGVCVQILIVPHDF